MAEKPKTKLAEWMKKHRYSDKLFAIEVSKKQPKPVTAHTVFNWRHGLRIPRAASMSSIMEITGREVTANDFVLVEQQG